jgi:hypothetical protein
MGRGGEVQAVRTFDETSEAFDSLFTVDRLNGVELNHRATFCDLVDLVTRTYVSPVKFGIVPQPDNNVAFVPHTTNSFTPALATTIANRVHLALQQAGGVLDGTVNAAISPFLTANGRCRTDFTAFDYIGSLTFRQPFTTIEAAIIRTRLQSISLVFAQGKFTAGTKVSINDTFSIERGDFLTRLSLGKNIAMANFAIGVNPVGSVTLARQIYRNCLIGCQISQEGKGPTLFKIGSITRMGRSLVHSSITAGAETFIVGSRFEATVTRELQLAFSAALDHIRGDCTFGLEVSFRNSFFSKGEEEA